MIASLRGVLQYKAETSIVLDVAGVGYEVHVTVGTFLALPVLGEELFLHVYSHIKEDSFTLFGFCSVVEKETFETLLHVSGIGPKLAVAVLSAMAPGDFSRAILSDNITSLTKISGVGKKTAERMCLELKDKVSFIPSIETSAVPPASSVVENEESDDAVSVLVNLGYPENSAREAVSQAIQASSVRLGLQELIRESLRSLA